MVSKVNSFASCIKGVEYTRKNKIRKVFNYFSQDIEETVNTKKTYILNDIPFIDKPIVKLGNSYIMPSIYTILRNSQYLFEKDILNSDFSRQYAYTKGKYLENEIAKIFRNCMKNSEILQSAKYTYKGKERETDVIVVYDNNVILVEAKSCALKEVSKRGNIEKLKEDYEQNIIEAFEQCRIAEEYIKNTKNSQFKSKEGELIIIDKEEIETELGYTKEMVEQGLQTTFEEISDDVIIVDVGSGMKMPIIFKSNYTITSMADDLFTLDTGYKFPNE